jgi:hypothetical protein
LRQVFFVILAVIASAVPAAAQQPAAKACADDGAYGLLDFWLGDWVVYSGDDIAGENRIEKILGGCAVAEFWVGSGGGEGQSLFFVDTDGRWQQVWVTELAANPGGVKQKSHVDEMTGDSVRFQGRISHPGLGSYLDRTTLTPNADGTVRQHIEVSTDGGETWKTTFDAVYVRRDEKEKG